MSEREPFCGQKNALSFLQKSKRSLFETVVPMRVHDDILSVCHGNPWTGHLGMTTMKQQLLQDFCWPRCFKNTEEFVRSCSICQKVGKPRELGKVPLHLVPLITELFRRLVVDIVGPLSTTESGHSIFLQHCAQQQSFPMRWL